MDNFFELYYRYTKRTEPPANFHAWCAIGALSALLGKKCWVPQGHFTVFPNLYIVLVGHPGNRKTTAMNIAKEQVKLVGEVPISAESSTREALIDEMAGNKVVAMSDGREIAYWQSQVFASELNEFLGGKHINGNMVKFMTSIWDEPSFTERTRKGGEVKIRNPYFGVVGCCTLNWINDNLKLNVITDGFSRRTIFCLDEDLNCLNPWPAKTREEIEALELLQRECVRINKMSGIFMFTQEARKYWDARYMTLREEGKMFSDKVQTYFSSKHILAMKVAICLSAAFRTDRVIDSAILKLAYRFLDETEKRLDEVFAGVGRNPLKPLADQLMKRLQDAGEKGLASSDLLLNIYGDFSFSEQADAVKYLESSGLVRLELPSNAGPTRYHAAKLVPPKKVANLLALACHTKPLLEESLGDQTSVPQVYPFDPETRRHLDQLMQKKSDLDKGILRRGKPRESGQNPPDPPAKGESSLVP